MNQTASRSGGGRDVRGIESGLDAFRASREFDGPVEPLGEHNCNDHFAHIYESPEEKFAAAVPFVRHGLESGERIVYVVDESSESEVRSRLGDAGVDVDDAVDSGALSFPTVQETYLRGGSFDADEMIDFYADTVDAATEEYEALRIVAEMSWLRDDETSAEEFMEYEQRINDLFHDTDSLAICQYNRERFDPTVIRNVVRTHPHLIYDGAVCHNLYYTPPEEFFGGDSPARENERILGTLRDRTTAKAELGRRERYLRRSYEIAADPALSFDEKLQALFDLGCEQFDLELGAMAEVDSEADRFEVEYVSDAHEHFEPGLELPLSETYCTAATEHDGVGSVDDPVEAGYDDCYVYREFDIRAYLGTYIQVEGDADRTFFFVSQEPRGREFSADERTFQRLMGQWVKYELERRQRERFLRESYQITSDPALGFEEKLGRLLELARDWMGLDAAGLTHRPAKGGEFLNEYVLGYGDDDGETWTDPGDGCYCREAIAADGPVGMADVRGTDWEDDEVHREQGLTCYLGTKVTNGSTPYGTLWVGSTEPREREFSETERTFLELIGQWVSYEVERRGHGEAQRELYEVTSDPDLGFEEKLERVLEVGCDRFGLEMGGLNYLPEWDGKFRLETGVGLNIDPDEELWSDPGNDCYCRRTITQDDPVEMRDVHETDWTEDAIYREFGIRSYLGTKVTSGSTPYGTLWFGSTEPRGESFSAAERSFIELIGQWVSYEVERREHNESQRELYEVTADPELDTGEKIDRLLELGCDHLDLPVGMVTREREGAFVIEAMVGSHPDLAPGVLTPPLTDNYCRRVVDTSETIAIGDAGAAGWDCDALYSEFDLQCYTGTQIVVDGDVYGTVCFADTDTREEFTEGERGFLDLLGQCLSYELEQRQHETDLEATIDRLEQSNDRLKQFAYAASHDLQEPLRMVSTYLQLLESNYADDLDEEAREYIDFAVDGADRMRAMVDDLLAYARVEQAEGDQEPVDSDAVLDRVTDDLRIQIDENDAVIDAESLPCVRGDSEQLEQLFSNLLSNAIKYNESHPPRVEIRADRREDRWAFSVADNGIGIDPDSADRIFEVFKRLHHDDEYSGTGIGLALCQEIVENHGSEIDVDSEPGEGTTFTFTLPAASDGER